MNALATETAWKTQYIGGAHALLRSAVHTMNRTRLAGLESGGRPPPYSNYVPIIQSSGMGKSRTVDEMAKSVFTLPFNLRSNQDDSGKYFSPMIVDDMLNVGDTRYRLSASRHDCPRLDEPGEG